MVGTKLVWFDCRYDAKGEWGYSIRFDYNKPVVLLEEKEFWQFMLECFSFDPSGRSNWLEQLRTKETIYQEFRVLPECGARIELRNELA